MGSWRLFRSLNEQDLTRMELIKRLRKVGNNALNHLTCVLKGDILCIGCGAEAAAGSPAPWRSISRSSLNDAHTAMFSKKGSRREFRVNARRYAFRMRSWLFFVLIMPLGCSFARLDPHAQKGDAYCHSPAAHGERRLDRVVHATLRTDWIYRLPFPSRRREYLCHLISVKSSVR